MEWGYISGQKLESERSKSLASKGLENISQVPGNPPEVCQNHDARKVVLVTFFKLKIKWGYILAQKLEIERSKSFAGSVSLETKTSTS